MAMFDPRIAYLSAVRGLRTNPSPISAPPPPSIPSPVGGRTSTTAANQAAALRKRTQQPAAEGLFESLPTAAQSQLRAGYGAGGFEGVRNAVGTDDWYNLPEHVRTQLLAGVRE